MHNVHRFPSGCKQTLKVNQFFLELYVSAAEPMPHEDYVVGTGVDDSIADGAWPLSDAETSEEEVPDWDPDRSAPSVVQEFLGPTVGLRRRYLQHTCLSHLYWLFLAGFERPGVSVSVSDSESGGDEVT